MSLVSFPLRTQATAIIKKTKTHTKRCIYAFAAVKKKKKNILRNTFCSDKHLYFLAKKKHPTLLQDGTLRHHFFLTVPPFLYYSPLFVTVCHSFALFVLYSLFRSVQTPVWAIVYCIENFRKTRKILYCNATFSYGTLIKQ